MRAIDYFNLLRGKGFVGNQAFQLKQTVETRILFVSSLAGVEGLEPPVSLLESDGLPLTDTPICLRIVEFPTLICNFAFFYAIA